jgi:hypothetical protein
MDWFYQNRNLVSYTFEAVCKPTGAQGEASGSSGIRPVESLNRSGCLLSDNQVNILERRSACYLSPWIPGNGRVELRGALVTVCWPLGAVREP